MPQKVFKVLLAVFAIQVGLYPCIYFLIDRKFGLLQSKSEAVLTNVSWNIGFYVHIILGGLALLIGWMQFNKKIREKKLKLHRSIGKVYVISALLSALASLYVALYARGGIMATLGFICLGIIWFYTTLKAYIEIKNKEIMNHQKMMIYSYAACFSAVTLRIYLPLLTLLFHNIVDASRIVAWLCWIPNIFFAYFLVNRLKDQKDEIANNIEISNNVA